MLNPGYPRSWRSMFITDLATMGALLALSAATCTAVSALPVSQTVTMTAGAQPASSAAGFAHQTTIDCGTISAVKTPVLHRVVELRNSGSASLSVVGIAASCHCTSVSAALAGASIAQSGAALTPASALVVPAGSVLRLSINVTLGDDPAGTYNKSVTVQTRIADVDQPPTILALHFAVQPVMQFQPSVLNFGNVHAGKVASLLATITFDPSIPYASQIARFQSSDPALTAGPIPSPATATIVPTSSLTMTKNREQVRVVIAPDAPLGPMLSQVSCTLGHYALGVASPLAQARLIVTATVVGDVQLAPSIVAFGTVPHGTAITRILTVSGVQPFLTAMTESSPYPWLSLTPLPISPDHTHRDVKVTLAADAPTGVLSGSFTIALLNGESARIPVTAYVSR
jgi:hypothetical protein